MTPRRFFSKEAFGTPAAILSYVLTGGSVVLKYFSDRHHQVWLEELTYMVALGAMCTILYHLIYFVITSMHREDDTDTDGL